MFKAVLVLGHISGIRIQIHISWVFILILLLVTMSTGFHYHYPAWTLSMVIGTAVVTALMFFASILAHELGHSVVASVGVYRWNPSPCSSSAAWPR